jgi:hypothetical protein
MDDFSDTNGSRNLLGGAITADNLNLSLVAGQQAFIWKNNNSDFWDYLTVFQSSWCEYNLSTYTKLRFQMKATASGKSLNVVLFEGNGTCPANNPPYMTTWTFTPTTTLAWYEFDLSVASKRNYAMWLEIDANYDPRSPNDTTTFTLDNIELR